MDVFENLVNENIDVVLQTLDSLNFEKEDTIINAYLLNLGYFHPSIKVKNIARKKLTEFQCEKLIEQIENNWKKTDLKEQNYYRRELYENILVDSSEFLTIAQATRRHYFLKFKKTRFISLAHTRYGDDIENIFDCYQVPINRISENILKLKHITVANFNNQINLNFEDVIKVLSKLPNLQFLQIAKSNLEIIPQNLNQLSSLKRLIIEYNPINSLGNYKSEKLERLEIKGTKIKEIDFDNFPNLKELWVDGKSSKEQMNFKNIRNSIKLTSGLLYSENLTVGNTV